MATEYVEEIACRMGIRDSDIGELTASFIAAQQLLIWFGSSLVLRSKVIMGLTGASKTRNVEQG